MPLSFYNGVQGAKERESERKPTEERLSERFAWLCVHKSPVRVLLRKICELREGFLRNEIRHPNGR